MNIDTLTNEAVELLKRMIAVPSISRDETAVTNLLEEHLTDHCGLTPSRCGNNLWMKSPDFDADRPTLLLNAHLDTVKPVAAWQRDPFCPTCEGDILYGLGSNDDGASVVCLLQTFRVMCEKKRNYNLILLLSAEEEVSGKNGIESVLPLLPHIDVALVGEPTGMHPAIAEKGLMVLDVTTHGKAGHAARNEGINAIYKALPAMEWFRTYRFEKVSNQLGAVKMSVTIVNAGTQHNVVPDTCTFTVDVRSNEHYSNEDIYHTVCANVDAEVKARSFRLNSSHIQPEHPLVQRAVQAGRKPFGSPTLSDQALMPFPSLKMGPGDSARSHTADEYIRISEVREAIALYIDLLDGLEL